MKAAKLWAAYVAVLIGVESVEDFEEKFKALPESEQAAWVAASEVK